MVAGERSQLIANLAFLAAGPCSERIKVLRAADSLAAVALTTHFFRTL
jgi:hypothetical protein